MGWQTRLEAIIHYYRGKEKMSLDLKDIDKEKIDKTLKEIKDTYTEAEAVYLISLLYHTLPDKLKVVVQVADDLYHQGKVFGVKVE